MLRPQMPMLIHRSSYLLPLPVQAGPRRRAAAVFFLLRLPVAGQPLGRDPASGCQWEYPYCVPLVVDLASGRCLGMLVCYEIFVMGWGPTSTCYGVGGALLVPARAGDCCLFCQHNQHTGSLNLASASGSDITGCGLVVAVSGRMMEPITTSRVVVLLVLLVTSTSSSLVQVLAKVSRR